MVLCFDIGGTSIKYGLAYEEAGCLNFRARKEMPTNAKVLKGPGIVEALLKCIGKTMEQYSLEGVAISTAGMVDWREGIISYANDNIPEYTGIKLKEMVEKGSGLPCVVENDVNCAALGEAVYGAGKGTDSVLCVTVGTGIGGAVILNQNIWHGHTGSAGEIGYMPLGDTTLEAAASTTALVKRVEKRAGELLDGYEIFERAKAGEEVCISEIRSMCEALVKGIVPCTLLLNPEIVVLGGGVMAQGEYLEPILKECLELFLPAHFQNRFRLAFATLGNNAGMAGAFCRFRMAGVKEQN